MTTAVSTRTQTLRAIIRSHKRWDAFFGVLGLLLVLFAVRWTMNMADPERQWENLGEVVAVVERPAGWQIHGLPVKLLPGFHGAWILDAADRSRHAEIWAFDADGKDAFAAMFTGDQSVSVSWTGIGFYDREPGTLAVQGRELRTLRFRTQRPDEVGEAGEAGDEGGQLRLSFARARESTIWRRIEQAFRDAAPIEGTVVGKVKGGLKVDIGVAAFLPGSHVDLRPVRDLDRFVGKKGQFAVLKFNRARANVVVSRRAVLENERTSLREETLRLLEEGVILEGTVKNITDYGAFVDLGGIDGLLHVTDMSWKRISHPSQVLNVGDTVKVQIVKINPDTQRISLGMKQLLTDPWDAVDAKYPVGAKFTGRVTNITDYGAFVELEAGVEGLVHVSEMSWTKKNLHPSKILSTSQEVDVQVIDVDGEKRRISLGIKQAQANPWDAFKAAHPVGSVPVTNTSRRDPVPATARSPDQGSISTKVTPSGTGNSTTGRSARAACMNAVQIGVAARPPVSSSPSGVPASKPTQTPVSSSGV